MATRKTIPIKGIDSWSFSRYNTYKECPLKAKFKFIDKRKEPGNDAMNRGSAIHDLAESYVKGVGKTLPPELALFKKDFAMLRKQYKKSINGMVVEDTWAFTKDWTETQWNNWTACWVRIKLDLAHHEDETTLVITDWKTGKFRIEDNETYLEQLELYALAAFLLYEHIETVKPRLGYLDQGMYYPRPEDPPLVFTRADLPRLQKLWEKRVKPMFADRTFAPRPNSKCKWCFFRKSNETTPGGGGCKY